MTPESTLMTTMRDRISGAIARMRPRRAYVGAETAGVVTLKDATDATAGEPVTKLAGPPLVANQEVLTIRISESEEVVLGAIQRGVATSGWTFATLHTWNRKVASGGPYNLRNAPTTSGLLIKAVASGTLVYTTGNTVDADGYTWHYVRVSGVSDGWIISTALTTL